MTIKDYIGAKLAPFGFNDVVLADYALENPELDVDTEVTSDNADEVNMAVIPIVEYFIFYPRQTNISEGGFSVSYNFDNLYKWYLWLCRKYGREPDEAIVEMSGLSVITDRSDIW